MNITEKYVIVNGPLLPLPPVLSPMKNLFSSEDEGAQEHSHWCKAWEQLLVLQD